MNLGDTKKTVIAIVAVVVVISGAYGALVMYTGFTLPFSSVVSESMQHDNYRSEIDAIDTGDIVIVADKSKVDIQSYVKGTQTGKKSFGDYGSVIIYNRDVGNPVIHRAIVWLDYDQSTNTWSSEDLKNYNSSKWYCDNGSDYQNLSGKLTIIVNDKTAFVNLDSLQKKSGYLTMGDNPETNRNVDQTIGIINHAIGMDDIRSVAVLEVPWFGTIKLILNDSVKVSHVPNSLPSLIMEILCVFALLFVIDAVFLYKFNNNIQKSIKKQKEWTKYKE